METKPRINNPYARAGRPLYDYDRYVDRSAKRMITLQRNLVAASSLGPTAKTELSRSIDSLESALRHGTDSHRVKFSAACLSAAIRYAFAAQAPNDVYGQGLLKSGQALRGCFRTTGTVYDFHETVGPQQDAYFAILKDDFFAMGLASLTRPQRPAAASAIAAEAARLGVHVTVSGLAPRAAKPQPDPDATSKTRYTVSGAVCKHVSRPVKRDGRLRKQVL